MRVIFCLIILTVFSSPSFAELHEIPFSMAAGEGLVVRLPSNPSTGYDWEIVQMPFFLEVTGTREFVQDSIGSGMVGVGGVTVWKFQIVSPDSGVLGFACRRPWETAPPIEIVEYRLIHLRQEPSH